jgi:peptidoglycan/LPS O-acetylase OafA/YrhL
MTHSGTLPGGAVANPPPVVNVPSSAPVMSAPSARHVTALDGVRGIAVILVMLLHYEVRRFRMGFPGAEVFHAAFSFGWAGVDLFFVLSGFLITGILWDAKHRPNYFRRFYARRTLRIFPVYYAFLALIFIVLPALRVTAATPVATQAWYWTYTNDFLVALKGWGSAAQFAPHFWSLAIEEQFYLVWPLIILHLSRQRAQVLCVLVILAAIGFRWWVAIVHGDLTASWVLPFTRMDALAVGALLALTVRGPLGLGALLRRCRPAAIALSAVLIWLAGWRGNPQSDRLVAVVGLSVVALVFGWFVAEAYAAPAGARLASILGNRPLVWFGKRSYALYIFHYPIVAALSLAGFEIAPIRAVVGTTAAAHMVFLIVNVGLSALAAQLSWQLIESPFLSLKARFA